MRLFYNIFFSGLFFIPMLITAQDGKLNIDASRSAEGIMLNWVPKSSEVWTENFKTGFNLMRVEIDANGNEKGIPSIISEKILPKTKEWFLTNAKEERGLMEVIGSLLYDKDLVGSDSGVGMSKLDQYNYLMYESKNSNIIAAAIGLSFTDSSAKKDGLYRYTISNISKIKLGSIDISDINRESFQNGGYEYLDFKFPDDKSLSDMLSETEYQPEVESIQTISRAYGDSIVVRWAPTGSTLWMQGMKDGYEVFRKNSAEEEILVATVYPWKSDMFTPAIMVDTMALAAASIIDGLNKPNKKLDPLDQNMVFETRFGMALYTADLSGLAGDILGLRYVDKDVVKGARYQYTIKTKKISPLFYGQNILINNYEPVQAPEYVKVIPGDKKVRIEWPLSNHNNGFSSYIVERSTDREKFEIITKPPLVFTDTKDFELTTYYFSDELTENYTAVYYRIKGSNSFGEWSEYATVMGQGFDLTPPDPVIIKSVFYDAGNSEIGIQWEDVVNETDLDSYSVLMSELYDGAYSAISPKLSKEDNFFSFSTIDFDMDRSFNFKIQCFDKSGNMSESEYYNLAIPDLYPPKPPDTLAGFIDSTGLVSVAWNESTSSDVTGYWLYWANSPDDEMSLVNDKLLLENFHQWQIEAVSLNKTIYFCIRAQDVSYNKGIPSEIIEVKRPDKVSPTAPIVTDVSIKDRKININWQLSPSEDVQSQQLLRKIISGQSETWKILTTINPKESVFIDSLVEIGKTYDYALLVIDDSNNYSETSNSKSIQVGFPSDLIIIDNFSTSVNSMSQIDVSWAYKNDFFELNNYIIKFDIYRSVGGHNLEFYKSTSQTTFTDNDIQPNVLYNYAVRVKFDNGWTGALSEVKSILLTESNK